MDILKEAAQIVYDFAQKRVLVGVHTNDMEVFHLHCGLSGIRINKCRINDEWGLSYQGKELYLRFINGEHLALLAKIIRKPFAQVYLTGIKEDDTITVHAVR